MEADGAYESAPKCVPIDRILACFWAVSGLLLIYLAVFSATIPINARTFEQTGLV
jgi:hypothetical protein